MKKIGTGPADPNIVERSEKLLMISIYFLILKVNTLLKTVKKEDLCNMVKCDIKLIHYAFRSLSVC